MALKRTLIVGTLLAAFAVGTTASGQIHTPSATFEHRAIETPDKTGPLVTPGVYNYDAQMFAPFEFTNDKQKEPNCGFFASMDKTLTSVPRSKRNGTTRSSVPVGNDWNWGERYTMGWMTEQDSGWLGSFQTSEGAYYAQGDMDDAMLLLGFDRAAGTPQTGGVLSTFGGGLLTTGGGHVTDFGHAAAFTNRFHVGELNRVFRQALKNGDYYEPYFGGRYTNVNDSSLDDNVYAYIDDDGELDDVFDRVGHRFRQTTTNSAIGFQMGARHNRRRGRFRYTTDAAVAASYNHQRYTATDIFFVDIERGLVSEKYFEENTFVPTLDLEFGVSYNVTRDLTLNVGTQLMYLWQGISRVNTLPADVNPNSIATDPSTRDTRVTEFNTVVFDDEGLIDTSRVGVNFGSDNPIGDLGPEGIFNDRYLAAGFTFGLEWKR